MSRASRVAVIFHEYGCGDIQNRMLTGESATPRRKPECAAAGAIYLRSELSELHEQAGRLPRNAPLKPKGPPVRRVGPRRRSGPPEGGPDGVGRTVGDLVRVHVEDVAAADPDGLTFFMALVGQARGSGSGGRNNLQTCTRTTIANSADQHRLGLLRRACLIDGEVYPGAPVGPLRLQRRVLVTPRLFVKF